MSTSPYFQKFEHTNEQNLIDSIVIESIRIYGHDVLYIRRSADNMDSVFNEDDQTSYKEAYDIEMYIKNVDGFEGEGDFVGRFGLEIRDQITFSVAQSSWKSLQISGITRPQEGDLIWFPLTKKLFQIMYVEHEAVYYQTGALQTYDLSCELFEYSGEDIDTGRDDVDAVETQNAFQTQLTISSLSANFTAAEIITGASSLVTAEVITNTTTSLNVINMTGTFTAAEVITGGTSGSTAVIGTVTTEFVNDPQADNAQIETQADSIIDFSENNPFSEEW
jgi:hypothetical protein